MSLGIRLATPIGAVRHQAIFTGLRPHLRLALSLAAIVFSFALANQTRAGCGDYAHTGEPLKLVQGEAVPTTPHKPCSGPFCSSSPKLPYAPIVPLSTFTEQWANSTIAFSTCPTDESSLVPAITTCWSDPAIFPPDPPPRLV